MAPVATTTAPANNNSATNLKSSNSDFHAENEIFLRQYVASSLLHPEWPFIKEACPQVFQPLPQAQADSHGNIFNLFKYVLENRKDAPAMVHETDEKLNVTFGQLHHRVQRIHAALHPLLYSNANPATVGIDGEVPRILILSEYEFRVFEMRSTS
jgi:hypothetical protein